tara:strand:+ start:84 stop:212 length:129 start_codon:yes stop_codon:yes gene_type:complete
MGGIVLTLITTFLDTKKKILINMEVQITLAMNESLIKNKTKL